MPEERIVLTLTFRDRPDQTLELSLPPPDTWTEDEPEQLLAAIYAALKPHALYRLTLREGEPDHERQLLTNQLEVVCDTDTASTPPLALSAEALMALQRVEFRMPEPKVVRLEEWQATCLSPLPARVPAQSRPTASARSCSAVGSSGPMLSSSARERGGKWSRSRPHGNGCDSAREASICVFMICATNVPAAC